MGFKAILRKVIFFALRLTTVPHLLRRQQKGKLTIVCMHDPRPEDLERVAQALRQCYTLVSLEDWRTNNLSASDLNNPMAAITLDDGHRGNLALLESIARNDIPVSIYLCSSIVGTHRHYWWTHAAEHDLPLLKTLTNVQRLEHLGASGFDEQKEYSDRQALDWSEVSAMTEQVDFQAHTRFHPVLPNCDRRRAASETLGCKEELQRRGLDVIGFAYPNGDYSDRDADLVRDAGFAYAVTLESGSNDHSTDPYRLRRTVVDDNVGVSELIVRMSGLWDRCMKILGREKPYGHRVAISD